MNSKQKKFIICFIAIGVAISALGGFLYVKHLMDRGKARDCCEESGGIWSHNKCVINVNSGVIVTDRYLSCCMEKITGKKCEQNMHPEHANNLYSEEYFENLKKEQADARQLAFILLGVFGAIFIIGITVTIMYFKKLNKESALQPLSNEDK